MTHPVHPGKAQNDCHRCEAVSLTFQRNGNRMEVCHTFSCSDRELIQIRRQNLPDDRMLLFAPLVEAFGIFPSQTDEIRWQGTDCMNSAGREKISFVQGNKAHLSICSLMASVMMFILLKFSSSCRQRWSLLQHKPQQRLW